MARACERCGSTEDLTPLDGLWICSKCARVYSSVKDAFTRSDPEVDLPQYLVDPIRKTSSENLKKVIALSSRELQNRNSVEERMIEADEGEEIVEVQEQSSGPTTVIKKVPCGKNCNGCPHGPYEYAVQRSGDDLIWEYVGPVD